MKSLGTQSEAELRETVERAVRACFAEIPGISLDLKPKIDLGQGVQADWVGTLRTPTQSRLILIECKKTGQPRAAREAVNSLLRARNAMPTAYGIFVAPFISDEADRILADDGFGFIDLAGNCRINFGEVYIRREGRENLFTRKRDLRSLYSPKAERVLRVLMADPKKVWKVEPLAKAAAVSLGQVSNVKKLLEAREWTRRAKTGFFISEPGKLLDEWAQAYRSRTPKSVECYSLDALADLEKHVAGSNAGGVLTAFSAAARRAPAVRYQRAMVYTPQSADSFISKLGLKRVNSGGNLLVLEPYDDGVFMGAQTAGDVKIASQLQTYLDLKCLEGRGDEAAEALRQGVLERQW